MLILLSYSIFSFCFDSNNKLEIRVFSFKLPLLMPLMRPPSDERTAVPILTVSFLLHAEKNALATDTVGSIGFNEFLQYTSFHKLLLIIYIISS